MKLLIQREYIICRWIDNGCTASSAQWHGLTVLKHSSMLLRPTSHRKGSCCVHAAFAEIKRSSQEDILYMSTFLKRVSWITILIGTKHGDPGVPMEDNEEDNDDDNIPDRAQLYEAGALEDEQCMRQKQMLQKNNSHLTN